MSTATTTVKPETTTTGRYTIDPSHSEIGFTARHAMITKVRGAFTEFSGTGYFDAAEPSNSNLELRVQVASVNTRSADRDGHLVSADFFDAEQYPEITFVSAAVEASGDDTYRVTGDLTIKDVTAPITFELTYTGAATDPFNNQRIGFEGSVTVNRKDWGLTWNAALETGGVLVSEKVTLTFDVSAIAT